MELKRNVWLIYKEIITNAAKHSRCSTVTIGLRFHSESEAELEVHDDGRGFDPEAVHGGNGLKNIRSRAESVGGRVNVVTGTGGGTRWNLRFPV
jgi:signal transduction histidine kinase